MRIFHLVLASLFFALAVLGAILPILPTTPFLLLTSWSLMRAAPRLDAALRRSPLFGPLLEDWRRHRGLRLHVKVTAIGTLLVVVSLSLWLGGLPPWGTLTLLVVAGVGVVVIACLRTVGEDRPRLP